MSLSKKLGILKASTSALFLCDMQVKFAPNIAYFPQIVNNSKRVFNAAQIMELPVLATEQYPKGLGPTVPELGLAEANIKPYEKTCFSMVAVPDLMKELTDKRPDVKSVIICGIETHACIYQTSLDLIDQYDLDVHVVVDCCSSRSLTDRKYAFEAMKEAGVFLTTSERIILGLAPDAAHPKFRHLQKLVMKSAEDTGLL
jgi:nicotinamidase-related amidase